MNARTLKALRGSIKKWEKIVAGTGKDRGTELPAAGASTNSMRRCYAQLYSDIDKARINWLTSENADARDVIIAISDVHGFLKRLALLAQGRETARGMMEG